MPEVARKDQALTTLRSIFGPPGTGKTQYLLQEIERLIASGIDRERIAYLSFTRAAAKEALQRMGLRSSEKVSTLHALVFKLCDLSRSQVVTPEQMERFATLIGMPVRMAKLEDLDQGVEVGDELFALYQLAGALCVDPELVYSHSHRPGSLSMFKYFVSNYVRWKASNGLLDYNDFLTKYLAAPVDFDVDVLFVDEAQDLSILQWKVIHQLATKAKFVYIAGDDDQAIYEWAGADPHGMVNYERAFGANTKGYEVDRTILSKSWRLPRAIYSTAIGITRTIGERVFKAFEHSGEDGLLFRHGSIATVRLKPDVSTLVLFRNHAQRSDLETYLIQERLPFASDTGRPAPLQSRYARAIRAFQRMQDDENTDISEGDRRALVACVQDRYKRIAESRDFLPLLPMPWQDVLRLPWQLKDYFSHIDLAAECKIRLGSIHSSKGREADRVVVYTGMTTRTIETMINNPDSEARVWYVAVTRAKKHLDIVEGFNGYQIP